MLISIPTFFSVKGGGGNEPTIHTYDTGSGTETILTIASQLVVQIWAAGGDGGIDVNSVGGGGGGGGGGYSIKTVSGPFSAGTISYSVGVSGGTRTSTAGGGGQLVNMTANGGTNGSQSGGNPVGGAGGTASGGDTNTTGENGYDETGPNGGWGGGSSSNGGAGGVRSEIQAIADGDAPGGGGAGQVVTFLDTNGFGADGRVRFTWS